MVFLKKIITSLTHFLQGAKLLIYQFLQKILPKPIKQILIKVIHFRDLKIISQNKLILSELLKNYIPGKDYSTIIIFPPSLDWDVQLFQRPQQLALALAKEGALVFYTQPKPDRNFPPFELISERLFLCKVHVDTFQIISEPNIYLLTWNSNYATRFSNPRIIYDFVDDIDVFYGDKDRIKKGHEYLLKNANIVLATANKLVEEAKHFRSGVIYSPNGVVFDHFAAVGSQEQVLPPSDLLPLLKMLKPIIGYYGALARWFDYELLKGIAQRRQDYLFVLIGPDYDGTVKHAGISHLENIYWLGVKQYAELPTYLHFFDVATIPFLVNDITHATSPLKLFEYMAGGKPIVITPMRESMQYQGVLVADGPEEFAEKLDQAVLLTKDPQYINEIKQLALQNTWENRAEEILRNLKSVS